MSEEELEILEQHLKDRSRKFIKLATLSLSFIAGIIIIGLSLYYYGGQFVVSKSLHLNKEKVEIINEVTERQLKGVIGAVHEQNFSKSKEGYYKILSNFRHESIDMSQSVSDIEKNQLLILVLAIGATICLFFLLAFLIQTLKAVYKYNMKLGSYFEGRADSVRYTGSTFVQEEETLARFLTPENLSFGVSLINPTPEAKDIAKEMLRSDKFDSLGSF